MMIYTENKYRIITDRFRGFECQVLLWWFPFCWLQLNGTNTHGTIEDADEYIKNSGIVKNVYFSKEQKTLKRLMTEKDEIQRQIDEIIQPVKMKNTGE